jgi:hypothetical protein
MIDKVAGAPRVASTTSRTTPQGHSKSATPKLIGADHLHKPTKPSSDDQPDRVGKALLRNGLLFDGTSVAKRCSGVVLIISTSRPSHPQTHGMRNKLYLFHIRAEKWL